MNYVSRSGERWKQRNRPVRKMPALRDLVNQIATLRIERNWSRRDFEKISKVSSTYLGQLERGERVPSMKTLQKIADAFNMELVIRLEEKENEGTTL